MALYICDTGYGLSGVATRTCESDVSSTNGAWSGIAPTCEGMFGLNDKNTHYSILCFL